MTGATFFAEPETPPMDVPQLGAPRIFVFRYDPADRSGEGPWFPMPNLQLLNDQYRADHTPHLARYRFIFDDRLSEDFPRRWHEVFGDQAGIPYYSVRNDDRIVSLQLLDDETIKVLADGFASIPQLDADGSQEIVTFETIGVPIRCWDLPLPGALTRDGTDPRTPPPDSIDPNTDDADRQTERVIRFNPDGRPNMVPVDGWWTGPVSGRKFPTFVDPLIDNRTPDVRDWWDVGAAALYLMETGNIDLEGRTDPWVKLPDFDEVRALLVDYEPTTPDTPIDWDDPSTFKAEKILCHDLDVTGDCWVDALVKLLDPYDFGCRFDVAWDEQEGRPVHRLVIHRKDQPRWLRTFHAPPPGSRMDVRRLDQARLSIQASTDEVVNAFYAITDPELYQVCVVLAPMFQPKPGDVDPEVQGDFSTKAGGTGEIFAEMYRLFGAGEAGDRFWDLLTGAWKVSPLDLRSVFQRDEDKDKPRRYARVRRPAHGLPLLQKDEELQAGNARLEISTDYIGKSPALWDPEGPGKNAHWRRIGSGAWRLSDKMLGIVITEDDPWDWSIGKQPIDETDSLTPFPAGKVNVIQSMAAPTAPDGDNPRFWLRLTCVIQADWGIYAYAARRPASPTKYTVIRRDECKDRFKYEAIDSSMPGLPTLEGQTVPDPQVVRDDSKHTLAHTAARRRAHEPVGVAGTIVIPYISHAYAPGDQIIGITGRAVSLNEMDGENMGEPPRYPTIVGRNRQYETDFATTLILGDDRGEPAFRPNYTVAATRKAARKSAGIGDTGGRRDVKQVAAELRRGSGGAYDSMAYGRHAAAYDPSGGEWQ